MKTRIILVRHGETLDNKNHIIQGHRQGLLTKSGIVQAKKAGLRLKEESIDVIYSSDLKRAKGTAKQIAKYHNIKVISDRRLRERNFGKYDGKHRDILLKAIKKSGKDFDTFKPRGGENIRDIEKRSKQFFNELLEKYPGKNIMIVSHGYFILISLIYMMNDSNKNYKKYLHKNTGVSIFDLYKDKNNNLKIKIEKINCTKHLK
jgi:broad specificity phosphatase PhoE